MDRRQVTSVEAPAPVGPYSQGIAAGGLVFCAGQIGLDPATGDLVPGGVRTETRRAMENLAAVLAAAGASLQDIVQTTIYVTDMAEFAAVNEEYGRFFAGGAAPARATVAVAGLPKNARVEIACIAIDGRVAGTRRPPAS